MADSRINLLTSAPVTTSDDFFVIDGATNGTRKLNAYAPNIGGLAAFNGSTVVDSLPTAAYFGGTKRVSIGYDNANNWGFVATQDTGISWNELRLNPYGGMVKVPASTSSTSTITGAFVVGNGVDGGIGASGSIWSGGTLTATTGTNSGVLQLNLINNSAGNAASCLFRFNMGTRTASLQAYNDTHATLAGQLRIGTSNGDIVLVPSGVATLTLNASSTTSSVSVRSNHINANLGAGSAQFFARNASAGFTNGAVSQAAFFSEPGYTTFIGTTANGTNASYQGAELGSVVLNQQGYVISDAANGLLIHSINGALRFATGNPGVQRMSMDPSSGNLTLSTSTAATSATFGAFVVTGGVGIGGRIFTNNGLNTNADNETHISFVRNGTISIGPTSAATPKLAVGGGLQLSNTLQSISAWGDIGPQLSIAGAVITDTSSTGTVSRAVANSINATAFAASNVTTYTQAVSLFIADAPTANTNVTITHRYAIYTAGGRINFQGLPTSAAGLQAGTLWNDAGTLKVA